MNKHRLAIGRWSLAAVSSVVVTQSAHAWTQHDLEHVWRGGHLADGPTEASSSSRCRLDDAGAGWEPASTCLACHRGMTAHEHLIDVDYAATRQRNPGAALRPEPDAGHRGVSLPDGKIHCGSCHGARASPYKLVLPSPRLCLACHAYD